MARSLQLSFAAGEISPEMQGRIDARDYANGCKTLRNWLPRPQGAVSRRHGFRYVNAAAQADGASALIEFVYSTDQALVVELGDQVIRFHTQGASVLWGTERYIGSQGSSTVDVANNRLTFAGAHGFSSNDALRFTTTGTFPGGLDAATTYYAIPINSRVLQVSASAGPGSAVNITSTGSGVLRAWKESEIPDDYVTQTAVSSWDQPNSRINFASAHAFATGDRVKLSDGGGATYPGSPALGTIPVYYAIAYSGTAIELAATAEDAAAGTKIDFSGGSAPSGTFYVDRHYVQGDLFFWGGGGGDGLCYYVTTEHTASPSSPNLSAVYAEPVDGVLEVPSPYLIADVPDVHYAQSNDVMTLVHPSYAPRELRRLGATSWDLRTISFASSVPAPTWASPTAIVEDRGVKMSIDWVFVSGTYASYRIKGVKHDLAVGDVVWLENVGTTWIGSAQSNRYYVVHHVATPNEISLRDLNGTPVVAPSGSFGMSAHVYYASSSADNSQSYQVTSVDADGIESTPSTAETAENTLDVSGATNTLSWVAVAGAQKYRVYKELNGIYGRIGETETTSFTDDNIDPDLALTPPIADDDLSGTDYPRAAGYFEQRRVFAGTTLKPRQLWMTKSGTESDMTYSLPVQDDDRISVALAARAAATIRHVVPLSDMLLLTQQGEWRVTAVNSDAITPETVAVRQQSEIGASDVTPLVVNNVVVFAANRGGHVRELAFNWQAQGYVTGDLSLRAAHLFDGLEVLDAAYQRSPYPVCWFVSSSGKLLSLTYIPEEQVRGWAQHDTDGTVESVCVIPEGEQDSVYVCVKRTVNGSDARYIERLVPEVTASLTDNVFLDSAYIFDGLNTSATTLTLTGGTKWKANESVSLTASTQLFAGKASLGDVFELRSGGVGYRVQITSIGTGGTLATVKLLADIPSALQATATTSWVYCRKTLTGLDHLEGKKVVAVRDGGVEETAHVVTGGAITMGGYANHAIVGLAYTSDLETLPLVMQQVDGAGQGRMKNVRRAHLRVADTAGVRVGVTAADLEPLEGVLETALSTGERRVVVPGAWTDGGTLLLRQDKPLPATVLGMTLEVELGD